jgi:hypothetical protein
MKRREKKRNESEIFMVSAFFSYFFVFFLFFYFVQKSHIEKITNVYEIKDHSRKKFSTLIEQTSSHEKYDIDMRENNFKIFPLEFCG